jgi:hypothetical protein
MFFTIWGLKEGGEVRCFAYIWGKGLMTVNIMETWLKDFLFKLRSELLWWLVLCLPLSIFIYILQQHVLLNSMIYFDQIIEQNVSENLENNALSCKAACLQIYVNFHELFRKIL